jgi:hypothetical protein
MTPAVARVRAAILLYAGLQFVVLIAAAMVLYPPGYRFTFHFLSELGATRSWEGDPNLTAAVLFSIALGSVGLAFGAFAGAWRAFAFARQRARAAGIAAQMFGTLSGAAFVAVASTPVNLHLDLHNMFVVGAFGFLFGYAACMALVIWRNGSSRAQLVTSVTYCLVTAAYACLVFYGASQGIGSARGRWILVVSQKAMAAASIAYLVYVTITTRRQLASA